LRKNFVFVCPVFFFQIIIFLSGLFSVVSDWMLRMYDDNDNNDVHDDDECFFAAVNLVGRRLSILAFNLEGGVRKGARLN
jgi:hypothetical protein